MRTRDKYGVKVMPRRKNDGRQIWMRVSPPTWMVKAGLDKRRPEGTGTEDPGEAQRIAEEREAALRALVQRDAPGGQTVGQGLALWLVLQEAKPNKGPRGARLSEATKINYRTAVAALDKAPLAGRTITDVAPGDGLALSGWLCQLPKVRGKGTLGESTVKFYVQVFDGYWRWQVKEARQRKVTLAELDRVSWEPGDVDTAKRDFRPAEAQVYLEVWAEKYPSRFPYLLALIDTGMRKMEVAKLRLDQIDRAARVARFRQKRRKIRKAPLSKRVLEMLPPGTKGYAFANPDGTHPRSGQIGGWHKYVMAETRRRIDIPEGELDLHSLRRARTERLVEDETNLEVTRTSLGHANLSTTQGYYSGASDRAVVAASDATLMPLQIPSIKVLQNGGLPRKCRHVSGRCSCRKINAELAQIQQGQGILAIVPSEIMRQERAETAGVWVAEVVGVSAHTGKASQNGVPGPKPSSSNGRANCRRIEAPAAQTQQAQGPIALAPSGSIRGEPDESASVRVAGVEDRLAKVEALMGLLDDLQASDLGPRAKVEMGNLMLKRLQRINGNDQTGQVPLPREA